MPSQERLPDPHHLMARLSVLIPNVVSIISKLPRARPPIPDETTAPILGLMYHTTDVDTTVIHLADQALKNGWPNIGAHFVIEKDGRIEQTLHLDEITQHDRRRGITKEHKEGWLSVIVVGDTSRADLHHRRVPTKQQVDACVKLGVSVVVGTGGRAKLRSHEEELGGSVWGKPKCGHALDMNAIRRSVSRILDSPMTLPAVGTDIPPSDPARHEDKYWRRFPSWYEAALAQRNIADAYRRELLKSKELLEELYIEAQVEDSVDDGNIAGAIARIVALVG